MQLLPSSQLKSTEKIACFHLQPVRPSSLWLTDGFSDVYFFNALNSSQHLCYYDINYNPRHPENKSISFPLTFDLFGQRPMVGLREHQWVLEGTSDEQTHGNSP